MTTPYYILSFIVWFIYNFYLLRLSDILLPNKRIKHFWRLPVYIVNSLIFVNIIQHPNANSVLAYAIIFLAFFVNFIVLYKNTFEGVVICALPFLLHFMVFRSIVIAITAIFKDLNIYQVSNTFILYYWTMIATLFITSISIAIFLRIVPHDIVKLVNQSLSKLFLFSLNLIAFNIFLFLNSFVYSMPNLEFLIILNQITAPLTIIFAAYIIFFSSVRSHGLLPYKNQSETLKEEIDNEKFLRTLMLVDTLVSYDFNCTTDKLRDFTNNAYFNFDKSLPYTEMINCLANECIYETDINIFLEMTSITHIINTFDNGIREISLDYRSSIDNDSYRWTHLTMSILKDKKTDDIIALAYIKDIDKAKRYQINLEHKAVHDPLTGTYNKISTENLIKEKIKLNQPGAFFIIDLDNFKTINDNLGHYFGDAVIRKVSKKIQHLFRDEDIIGRIGGDEFIVFMYNTDNSERIYSRAKALCSSLRLVCKKKFLISASIGIALYPKHGNTFKEIYQNADTALYQSKNKGKNTYSIYSGEDFESYKNTRTAIDTPKK